MVPGAAVWKIPILLKHNKFDAIDSKYYIYLNMYLLHYLLHVGLRAQYMEIKNFKTMFYCQPHAKDK